MATTPTTLTVSRTAVILEKPADWDLWLSNVQRKANIDQISRYIDLTKTEQPPHPTEPIMPITPANFATLSGAQREEIKMRKDDYKQELAKYNKQTAALNDLITYIVGTTARTNQVFIKKETTPWGLLKALSKRLKPSDRARQLEVAKAYTALKKAPKGQQGIETWLQSWERIYEECAELDLPDVAQNRAIYDFLLAITAVDPTYGGIQEVLIGEKISRDPASAPTLFDVVEGFRTHIRLVRAATTKASSHSAFATFQGEQQPGDDQEQTGQRPSRPRQQQDSPPQCVCGEFHWFRECLYLMEHLRTPDWVADAAIQKQVDDKLKTSANLRRKIDHAKNWRPRQPSKPRTQRKRKNVDGAQELAGASTPPPPPSPPASHLAMPAFSAFSAGAHQLRNCWIIDSGSDIHICNDPAKFTIEKVATDDDIVYAGKSVYQIEAYGSCLVNIDTPIGKGTVLLQNVALVPGFLTNLVSVDVLEKRGFDWSAKLGITRDGKTVATVHRVGSHYVLVKDDSDVDSFTYSSFPATSAAPRPPRRATQRQWHATLGHPQPDAINNLEKSTTGVTVVDKSLPNTTKCVTCDVSKAHRQVSRRSDKEDPAEKPLARISYDLIQFPIGYNDERWVSHFRCYFTRMDWVYTHMKKGQATNVVTEFVNMAHTRYQHRVSDIQYFRSDGERSLGKKFDDLMITYGITAERTAPYTPAQNGGSERAGGVITAIARCIRVEAQLPSSMWPEVVKAAGYLNNRTPKQQLKWKTPFEMLTGAPPNLSHLRVYGCRAYPLNKNIPRLDKVEPRAHIGYLVGYDSSNIYRIWIPSQDKVVRTRDVTFDEGRFYDPGELDLGHVLREEVENLIEIIEPPPATRLNINDDLASYDEDTTVDEAADVENDANSTEQAPIDVYEQDHGQNQLASFPPSIHLMTPDSTPSPAPDDPTSTPTPSIHTPISQGTPALSPTDPDPALPAEAPPRRGFAFSLDHDENHILPYRTRTRRGAHHAALATVVAGDAYHTAFATGHTSSPHSRRLHRDKLPGEPKSWKQALKHPFAQEWKKAAGKEIHGLKQRGTFEQVPISTANAARLPLLWVFKYKFDSDGYLEKFKARICVRGDLQVTDSDTYAATLAARTFRALVAIAAVFDLDITQYDVVNAFANSHLDEVIYCRNPDGFELPGYCWRLLRALYGLKQSPLLWYLALTSVLEELGLNQVPGVSCLFSDGRLIVFFFVDDIVVLCSKSNIHLRQRFEERLFSRFEVRSLGEMKWFLNIRVIRNREERRIWLCQDSYIDKIAGRFHIDDGAPPPPTPLPSVPLVPSLEQASSNQIYGYQQRVGSVGFSAAITRPDVAYAHSNLSTFLKNPSKHHVAAADRVISYLKHTRSLAIEFSPRKEGEIFMGASDAAFADDMETRKSSDGYLFQLYGGPIDWRAAKQRTVTISTTEAELLSLSRAARELIWWNRFFSSIQFKMTQRLSILCDNAQTINAMEKDSLKLNTKLRHVDIHQHWLRQEVENGHISLQWVPSAEMPADGLTKSLPAQKHQIFVRQLNLVDIGDKLAESGD